MTDLAEMRALLREVDAAGGCTHPVRLAGRTTDRTTGEVSDRAVAIACKDRRAAVCGPCAARYRGDAWHLVVCGLAGGKGVPDEVASHPAVFATLTAPSFGAVHAHRHDGPCRPRRGTPTCPHGTALSCLARHRASDPLLGEPLCAECFDYRGAVLWNAHVGPLWNRTTVLVARGLAGSGGLPTRLVSRHLRVSTVKVAEVQRRGLVHLHAVLRIDGPDGPATAPPPWATVDMLGAAVRHAVGSASVPAPGGGSRIAWGTQVDVAPLEALDDAPDGPRDARAVASYLAKYVTKSTGETGTLVHRLTGIDHLDGRPLRPHLARLVRTAWALGAEPALTPLRLRAHAHTLGYRGHVTTKSRRYSTTFTALRGARRAFRRPDDGHEGTWHFAGRGYLDARAARLAETLCEA